MSRDSSSVRVVGLIRGISWRRQLPRLGLYLVLIVMVIYIIVPFYMMAVTTFKDPSIVYQRQTRWLGLWPGKLSVQSYINVFTKPMFSLSRYFANSVTIALGATSLGIVVSFLAAYALTRSRVEVPGAKLFYYLIIATMMIPAETILIGIFEVEHNLHLLNTYPGVVLPMSTNAIVFLILYNFLRGFPRELEDAARIDGATELRVAFFVVLPLTLPVMGACALFQFLGAWQAFVLPYILSTTDAFYTLPVAMRFFENELFFKMQELLTVGMIIVIPTLFVFLLTQRFMLRGISLGAAIKG